jgi:hypothetical protein
MFAAVHKEEAMTFPIAGIAMSAGGLEASSELLGAVPSEVGMAFMLVQHLAPDHQSLLSEILSNRTSLPVREARDGSLVQPDHVYVIPPNSTLTLSDGHLRLSARPAGKERFKPGDTLFHSLAETCAERAIGIVLSGGDADCAGLGSHQERRWNYLRSGTIDRAVSEHAQQCHRDRSRRFRAAAGRDRLRAPAPRAASPPAIDRPAGPPGARRCHGS